MAQFHKFFTPNHIGIMKICPLHFSTISHILTDVSGIKSLEGRKSLWIYWGYGKVRTKFIYFLILKLNYIKLENIHSCFYNMKIHTLSYIFGIQ